MKLRIGQALLALAFLAATSVPAAAAPITVGTWYLGSFAGSVGAPVTGGTGGGGASDPGAPAWTFSLVGAGQIDVIDCCALGDRFEVFDFGVSLGITSVGVAGGCVTFASCDALVGVGRGTFALPSGNHSITMSVFAANGDPGNNFFRVSQSAVPEPGTLFLLGGGLALVAARRFKRR